MSDFDYESLRKKLTEAMQEVETKVRPDIPVTEPVASFNFRNFPEKEK